MEQPNQILLTGWSSSNFYRVALLVRVANVNRTSIRVVTISVVLILLITWLQSTSSVVHADTFSEWSRHEPLNILADTRTFLEGDDILVETLFVENVGQWDPHVRFKSLGAGPTVWITDDGLWLTVYAPVDEAVGAQLMDGRAYQAAATAPSATHQVLHLHLRYSDINPTAELHGVEPVGATMSFFQGSDATQWQRAVPLWRGVRYSSIYPGVDLAIAVQDGQVRQTLLADDGVSASGMQAQLQVLGGDAVFTSGDMLVIESALGTVFLSRPQVVAKGGMVASNELAAQALSIVDGGGAAPLLLPRELVQEGASVDAAAVPSRELAAPGNGTLLYSSYIGGGDADQIHGMAEDDAGALYLTGRAESTDFPANAGVTTLQGNADIFVVKLMPGGNGAADLVYATLIGGAGVDAAIDLAVDANGRAIIGGATYSADFPTTVGAWQTSAGGALDTVVVTLGAAGDSLAYATYLGGSLDESAEALTLLPNGQIAVAGATGSTNFPVTADALQRTLADRNSGAFDAFLVQLQGTGAGAAELTYGTYLGGGRKDMALDLVVDGTGALYLAGKTDSNDFPVTAGGFDRTYNSNANLVYDDAFVAKIVLEPGEGGVGSGSSRLVYSSYLGGNDSDDARAIAVDRSGALYVTGLTISGNFPVTPDAFDRFYNGGTTGVGGDAYVAKLTPDGSRLEYSTYYGGAWYELGHAIAVDEAGRVTIVGETNSDDLLMPDGAYDGMYASTFLRYYDAFLARFAADGSALTYATYLGDNGVDIAAALLLGTENQVTVAGSTSSRQFPTTVGAFDEGYNDGSFITDPYDGFVSRLQLPPPPVATYRVAGRIVDSNNLPASGVRVELSGTVLSEVQVGTTDRYGMYAVGGLPAGEYTVTPSRTAFQFAPATRRVAVPPNLMAEDFVMRVAPTETMKAPLLVVHGFQGFSLDQFLCASEPTRYAGAAITPTTLGDLPEWFYADDEYDLYLAYLETGLLYTASLDSNALCLAKQIDALYEASGRQQVTLVAHSMGGLVARACLADADCRSKVKALYTMGTPHGGLNYNFLLRLYLSTHHKLAEEGICLLQSPLCEFATDQMILFNYYTPNQDNIRYGFIGGDETPLFPGALIYPTDGPNDGVVSTQSAIGNLPWLGIPVPTTWMDSEPRVVQYVTDEAHLAFIGKAYHENRDPLDGGTPEGRSQSYLCLRHLLSGAAGEAPSGCRAPSAIRSAANTPTLQTTNDITGTLVAGETVTQTVRVDRNSQTIFSLFWTTDTLELTLVAPNGERITPELAERRAQVEAAATAIQYSSTVTPTDFLRTASYVIPNAEIGDWQLVIAYPGGVDVSHSQNKTVSTISYVAFATLESALQLRVPQGALAVEPSVSTHLTATVLYSGEPVTNSVVTATLYLPDATSEQLTLTHELSGTYGINYIVPESGGGVVMRVVATGVVDGEAYSRQAERVWTIAPSLVTVDGAGSDHLQDIDVDGHAEALIVTVPLDVSVPATYTVRATLVASGSVEIGDVLQVISPTAAGTYTVALSFAGPDIRRGGLDGPYHVRDLIVINPALGNVPVLRVADFLTTAEYRADEFVEPPALPVEVVEEIYLPLVQR